MRKDALVVLKHGGTTFTHNNTEYPCLENKSTEILYDNGLSDTAHTILTLQNIRPGDFITIGGGRFEVYRNEMDSEILHRLFLKKAEPRAPSETENELENQESDDGNTEFL